MAQTSEWIEYDTVHNKLVRWQLPKLGPEARVTGYALTKHGQVFASIEDKFKAGEKRAGLFLLQRDWPQARWVRVKGTLSYVKGNYRQAQLLGSDDNGDLVFATDWSPATLTWLRIVPAGAN